MSRTARVRRALPAARSWAAAAAAALGPWLAAGAAQDPAVEVVELEAAGVPVIVQRVPNAVVAAHVFLRGGAAHLAPENAGIEHLLLEAATRGTERFPKDVFHARLAATGSSVGGGAGDDYSTFALRTIRESWDEAWELFADALLRPALEPAEVDLAREQLLNDVRRRRDDPDRHVSELADSVFYRGHPYALDPTGTEHGLADLDAADLREWHARRLARESLLLVVVGDVDPDDVRAKAEAAFGPLPESAEPPRVVGPAPEATSGVAVIERELPTNYVLGTFHAPTPDDEEDFASLALALSILDDRLFEEVRTKRNLSYAVFAGLSSRVANHGLLYVTAVEPDTTLKVIHGEVRRMQEEVLADSVLDAARSVYETRYWLALEANAVQAGRLGRYELVGGGWEEAADFIEEIRAVTADDVQRVMRDYVRNVRFVVLGDPARVDREIFSSM